MDFLAIVVGIVTAFVSWHLKNIYYGHRLAKYLRYEISYNAVLLAASLPNKQSNDLEYTDIAHTIALNSQAFSFEMLSAYRGQLHWLTQRRGNAMFLLYNNFQTIQKVGKELITLVKIDNRTLRQKKLLVQQAISILQAARAQSQLLDDIRQEGILGDLGASAAAKQQGVALETFKEFQTISFDESSIRREYEDSNRNSQ